MSKQGQGPDYATECMLVVYVCRGSGPNRFIRHGEVMADAGLPWPEPPITVEEMQNVTFAAKMALLKVLRQRKAKARAEAVPGAVVGVQVFHEIGSVCAELLIRGGPPPWMVGADDVPRDSFGVCGRPRPTGMHKTRTTEMEAT